MAAEHMLDVEVLTPEGEVFSGEVRQLSTRTEVGEIGILANHAPVLGALQPTTLRLHVSDSETKRCAQSHGWLQVFDNTARVLVEEAVPPEDLDAGALKEELSDAERRFSESDEDSAEWPRAERQTARRGVPGDRPGMSEPAGPSAGRRSRSSECAPAQSRWPMAGIGYSAARDFRESPARRR